MYAARDASVVYASVQMNAGEIWRSTDGGKAYAKRNGLTADGTLANYLGEQGWYDNIIWAGDPTNADFGDCGGTICGKVPMAATPSATSAPGGADVCSRRSSLHRGSSGVQRDHEQNSLFQQ